VRIPFSARGFERISERGPSGFLFGPRWIRIVSPSRFRHRRGERPFHSFERRSISANRPQADWCRQARKTTVGIDDRETRAAVTPRHWRVRLRVPHVVIHAGARTTGPRTRDREWKENRPPDRAQIPKHVRRSGRDKQQIVFLRDADVLDRTGVVASGLAEEKRSVMTLRPVNEAKVRGRMNSSAEPGQDRLHFVTVLDERADDFRGLYSRDPAAHAQNDAHASKLIDTRNIFHHDRVGLMSY